MSEAITILLSERQQAHAAIKEKIFPYIGAGLQAGKRLVMKIGPETRSMEQNRYQWPLLTAFSEQLQWPVNGRMVTMSPDDWKDVLTAAFRQETMQLAMGLTGGVVLLGQRTSRFTKPQFSEWIEFLQATAADRGVKLPAYRGDHDQ
jgi:NinB protein